jgi:hypothetical protein
LRVVMKEAQLFAFKLECIVPSLRAKPRRRRQLAMPGLCLARTVP